MLSSLASTTRVVLVPAASRDTEPGAVKVRRYRIARLRLDDRMSGDRHAHLRRSHD